MRYHIQNLLRRYQAPAGMSRKIGRRFSGRCPLDFQMNLSQILLHRNKPFYPRCQAADQF